MATTKYTLTSSWVQVATSTQEFIIENTSAHTAEVRFDTTTPSAGAAVHLLQPGQAMARMGAAGILYARDASRGLGAASVVVSTS